ncbi:rhodanese-like domain-containing protein [Bacillus aerolatus]|uniref:Rhodanese-like domain-containing protein n=1 Tax=Bacillus aerolatus TaxID=2653354 RepID=A0A6I1FK88_9BACI|nr:rhodanese-like domain-containing protein [Bacillus aerolatus]KAB7706481.1 rhodanese-like domain-containing protein [Bacillus aerolatus]
MSIIFYILLALFVFIAIKNMLPAAGIRNTTAAELKKEMRKKDKQWIDVRTPAEFKAGHINGFKNIPLQQLSARMNELDSKKEVVVMCQSGMRSQKAARLLKKKGFTNITNVAGGISTWN